jgi:hypothetical protein
MNSNLDLPIKNNNADWYQWVQETQISVPDDTVKDLKEENKKLKVALKIYKARLKEILIKEAGFPENEAEEIVKKTFAN